MNILNHKKTQNNYHSIVVLSIIACVLTCIGLLSGLTNSHYAYAHSLPVTETPAANSIVPKGTPLPSRLTIDFSERPSPTVSSIQVVNSKNEPVNNGDFKIIGDGGREAMTTLDTKKLRDGVYTVSWETQSLDDGHIAKGSFVFGIGNVGPGAASSIATGKSLQQASTTQAVTSPSDGFVRWPIIVAQAAVVGGIFSHLFLWNNFGSKIGGARAVRFGSGYNDKSNIPWLRRFFILLIASSIVILIAGSAYLFLQVKELSQHDNISSYWLVFLSQTSGASGIQWIMRSITSIIVIASVVSYYYITKRKTRMTSVSIERKSKEEEHYPYNKKNNRPNLTTSLLYVALITGAISILSNSITSHNAGVHFLPTLSTSLDWLHFMAVSIWVGGLFYISFVLLTAIGSRAMSTSTINTNVAESPDTDLVRIKIRSIVIYYLALLLPRFSLLATISLGVIGVSGLYMAWIQLHSLNALFSSTYGNILIIKLSAASPLILLGVYHQLKLHKNVVLVASLGQEKISDVGSSHNGFSSSGSGIDPSIRKVPPASQTFNNDNYGDALNKKNNNKPVKDNRKTKDIPSKFNKTIKIESLLAIAVLLAASLLTITSPPAMNMSSMAMTPSSSHSNSMSGMSMTPVKNSTYTIQTKIMNLNTKIEINPFYSGFNVFKVTFTDAAGKPYTKVSTTEIIFSNIAAGITNVVANLKKMGPGVFSVTGAYISQPGEWNIALSAQRVQDFDLNYEFTAKVTTAPTVSQGSTISTSHGSTSGINSPSNMQEPTPRFDSFAWLAIALAGAVIFGSAYYYLRSKKDLKNATKILEVEWM